MANAQWPGSLPSRPLYDGYQEVLANVVLRTQMDAGAAKVRRRFTAGVRVIRCNISLTSAQKGTLDNFFNDTLDGGSLRFDWVRVDTGATVAYRFTSPPQHVPDGPNLWRTTLQLEWMP